MTMPELLRWMRFPIGTAAPRPYPQRLVGARHDLGVLQYLPVRQGGHCGVFLDPPYSDEVRQGGLYAVDSGTVANDVRAWCEANRGQPALSDRPRWIRHRARSAGGSRVARSNGSAGIPPGGGMGSRAGHRDTSSTASGYGSLPTASAWLTPRMDLFCLTLHRRRQGDGMILTGPAIRAAIARGDITITPLIDNDDDSQIDQAGVTLHLHRRCWRTWSRPRRSPCRWALTSASSRHIALDVRGTTAPATPRGTHGSTVRLSCTPGATTSAPPSKRPRPTARRPR